MKTGTKSFQDTQRTALVPLGNFTVKTVLIELLETSLS